MDYRTLSLFFLTAIIASDPKPMVTQTHYFNAKTDKELDLQYALYLPNDYPDTGKMHPLVLFLHGAGERGDNLDLVKRQGIPKLIDDGNSFPFITIAPQCPGEGYWDRPEYVRSLISLIKEIMKTYDVDKTRIYGTGLSMGGFGTLAIAIKDPGLFAAIIIVCGGADLKKIGRINQLPIWLFHGDEDSVIPVENSLSIYDSLKPINKHVFLTIYKGVGHDSWTETYENEAVYEWLLTYRKKAEN